MTGQIRQGDVFLLPTRKRPSKAATPVLDAGRTILAYGEVTGHSHEVLVLAPATAGVDDVVPAQQLFEEPDGTRLLVLKAPCALTHQEHAPLELPTGTTFEIRRQCEWGLDEIRQVAD